MCGTLRSLPATAARNDARNDALVTTLVTTLSSGVKGQGMKIEPLSGVMKKMPCGVVGQFSGGPLRYRCPTSIKYGQPPAPSLLGETRTRHKGVVHAWVGQKLLKCNDFKSLIVRPR